MLLFWKLVDETQNSKPPEATRDHNSSKFSILLSLRAIQFPPFHYETPCKSFGQRFTCKYVGIICPSGWDRVNWSAKIWGCHGTPRDDTPVFNPNLPNRVRFRVEIGFFWATFFVHLNSRKNFSVDKFFSSPIKKIHIFFFQHTGCKMRMWRWGSCSPMGLLLGRIL